MGLSFILVSSHDLISYSGAVALDDGIVSAVTSAFVKDDFISDSGVVALDDEVCLVVHLFWLPCMILLLSLEW